MMNNIVNLQNVSLNFAEFYAKFKLEIPAVISVLAVKFGRNRDPGKTPNHGTHRRIATVTVQIR